MTATTGSDETAAPGDPAGVLVLPGVGPATFAPDPSHPETSKAIVIAAETASHNRADKGARLVPWDWTVIGSARGWH